MASKIPKTIHALEFGCQAPLKFFEHCVSCPRFSDDCPDLAMGKELLRGRKKIAYGDHASKVKIPAKAFNCLAPLYYFEKSRMNCGHAGRCREEGLLLALLDGKRTLDYSHKDVTELPRVRRRRRVARVATAKAREVGAS